MLPEMIKLASEVVSELSSRLGFSAENLGAIEWNVSWWPNPCGFQVNQDVQDDGDSARALLNPAGLSTDELQSIAADVTHFRKDTTRRLNAWTYVVAGCITLPNGTVLQAGGSLHAQPEEINFAQITKGTVIICAYNTRF
jgi:hypothetical protein